MSSGIYLLLGTNIGARVKNLEAARYQINKSAGKIIRKSEIYETAPWGVVNQPSFLNQAIQIESSLTPEKLLSALQQIEDKMGRVRERKWEARIVDIDILFYHQVVIHTTGLTIPHPRLQERNFTLVPLAELAPSFVHPVLKKTIQELLEQCTDTLPVSKFPIS